MISAVVREYILVQHISRSTTLRCMIMITGRPTSAIAVLRRRLGDTFSSRAAGVTKHYIFVSLAIRAQDLIFISGAIMNCLHISIEFSN